VLQGGAAAGIVGAALPGLAARAAGPAGPLEEADAVAAARPATPPPAAPPDPLRTARVERLLAAMTLEEKIGQLTMLSADLTVTGPRLKADYMDEIRAGRCGSLL